MRPVLVMDTRERSGSKTLILKHFERTGVHYIRSKLYCGDYTLLHDQSVCIDLKYGLAEVYKNLCTAEDHRRFRDECIRARDVGIRLIVLVEQHDIPSLDQVHAWINPRAKQWEYNHMTGRSSGRPPLSSAALEKAMRTMRDNYGIEWVFCSPVDSGRIICEILGLRNGAEYAGCKE